jgi:hypothetical protein
MYMYVNIYSTKLRLVCKLIIQIAQKLIIISHAKYDTYIIMTVRTLVYIPTCITKKISVVLFLDKEKT